MLSNISIGDYATKLYKVYKDEPLIGTFIRQTPTLIVKDLDLIKNILIKDFTKFADRGLSILEKVNKTLIYCISVSKKINEKHSILTLKIHFYIFTSIFLYFSSDETY